MPTRAYGRIVTWEGASLWVFGTRPGDGRYPKTAPHSHHAVQVTLALRGSFTLEARGGAVSGGVAAVAPDTEHTFEATEGAVAHLFVDPDGRAGRALSSRLFSTAPLVPMVAAELGDLPARLLADFEATDAAGPAFTALGRDLLAQLVPKTERDERPEARVRKMSAWAAARLDKPVSLEEAAAQVGLSSGRARHLFVENTGLPFRTYLLWLRLTKAVELFSVGTPLTDAAQAAGFSDSSHLSRTFKRMFGIAADSLRIS
ncbi:MAG TPA: AraC family transcriptional regulator [Polyangiaceae bacterium]|nr:AraC family transcriptional regulator [Polyangiaceae bacterium]